MIDLRRELRELLAVLTEDDVPFALCGGLALAFWGAPRATKDIDLLVPEDSVERVATLARDACDFSLDNGVMPFPSTNMRVRRVTKVLESAVLPLDILYVTPGLEPVWEQRVDAEWLGLDITVVSRDGLIEMKRLADRPRDRADIAALTQGTPDDDA